MKKVLIMMGVLALLIGLAGCFKFENPMTAGNGSGNGPGAPIPHDATLKGVNHAQGYCSPQQNCAVCHGSDLKGGPNGASSCYKCHGEIWKICGKSTKHDTKLGGVNHASGYCNPQQNCAVCHGTDLKGGPNGASSCFKCHGSLWKTCGQNTTHDQNLGGVKHAKGYCSPTSNCASCHGSDLRGGANGEPSCYKCHGSLWKTCGQNTNHDKNLGGVRHASGYCSPYQNCSRCHGSNLRGGQNGEPSCLKCHTQKKWMNCGATQHNKKKDGVYHAQNWCNPTQYCAPCHGSNLRGGPNGEPSCYRCHGDKWSKGKCSKNGGGEDEDALSDASLTLDSQWMFYHTIRVHAWRSSCR